MHFYVLNSPMGVLCLLMQIQDDWCLFMTCKLMSQLTHQSLIICYKQWDQEATNNYVAAFS